MGARPDGNPQTASIGIAECIAEAPESSTQLVEIADHRMYTAKQAGKDCICAGEEGYRRVDQEAAWSRPERYHRQCPRDPDGR